MLEVSSLADFKNQLKDNDSLQQAFKEDPIKAASELKQAGIMNDKWVFRVVVGALGFTVIAIVIGILFLMIDGDLEDGKIPTILTAISSAAIGGITGLLAPSPQKNNS